MLRTLAADGKGKESGIMAKKRNRGAGRPVTNTQSGESSSPSGGGIRGRTDAAQAASSSSGGGNGQTAQAAAGQTASAETARPLDKISAMGHAVWLMTQSAPHKHLFITDLEWLLMPAIAAGQFRLWRKDNLPLAFASWAFLNEETEKRMIAGNQRLGPGAWTSGDRLWLMDLIAPFGGKEEALKELKEKVFPGRTIKSLQPDAEGKMRVMEW